MSRADVAARAVTDGLAPAGFPVDPEKLARDLGVTVAREGNDVGLSGMLLRRDDQIIVGLNEKQPPAVQRFALAHLLGHLQIHARRDLILDTVERQAYSKLPSMPTDREEMEANRFAAALLAPEPIVRRMAAEADFRTARQLVELLASRFEMSDAAMSYRLMSLGIVMDY